MLDTPPVATTPDDGSDFYNTPLPSGTPVPSTMTDDSTPATEATPPVHQAPAIPGLGLISNPNDQQTPPTEQVKTEEEPQIPAVKLEKDEPMVESEDNNTAIKQESVETAVNQAAGDEAPATTGEAMEVDQKPEQSNLDASSGLIENNTKEEQGEEEHPEWEVDSSPYESSSDSSSDSDDSSEDEDYPILTPEEQARILMQAEAGSDDEGEGKGKSGGYIRSTNEVVEDVLPIPDVTITPEMPIVLLGKLKTLIENAALIEASTSGEYQVLESGSLLCSEDRKVLGVVAETLGRVENPLYTVMYATAAEPAERGLSKDMTVYYVPAHSTFVFTQPLKGLKGSDASNFHDEEVADEEMEFSDDEAEAEYKKRLKQKRQERKDARDGGGGRGKKGPAGPSKLSHTELNYDDAGGEDGYTPLARPKNYHEMMGAREAPVEGADRASGFRGGRGRGRGSDRGRGGRGRGNGGRGGSYERDQDRRPQNQQGNSSQHAPTAPQYQPAGYGQPAYPQQQQQQQQQQPQQPAFGMPQAFAPYQQYAPQQQAQLPQGAAPGQFPFQFPFQQPFAQPNPFQSIPPGAHINPLFLAALQQQQQYQQPQQQQYQQPQQPQQYQQPQQGQQNPAMNFDQVKAQLDLLRNLSNNQGPPPS
jgi:H/ACA ribonucleoprotein complex non-core subunit NAF1